MAGLLTPPLEEAHGGRGSSSSECKKAATKGSASRKGTTTATTTTTSATATARILKPSSSTSSPSDPGQGPTEIKHKRVWKACERCRMKKTKCDGESPCKRCKDDGLVCTAGTRRRYDHKQLPKGYAEVLENTQHALIATCQKLYTMVRNGSAWELGEPELNDRGQPVIHDIASKLGCLRPCPDLPAMFPENEEDFAELEAQLNELGQGQGEASDNDDVAIVKRSVSERSMSSRASSIDTTTSASFYDALRLRPAGTDESQNSTHKLRNHLHHRRSAGRKHALNGLSPAMSMLNSSMPTPPSTASPADVSKLEPLTIPPATLAMSHTLDSFDTPLIWSAPSSAAADDFISACHPLQYTAQFLEAHKQVLQLNAGNSNSNGGTHSGSTGRGAGNPDTRPHHNLATHPHTTIQPGMLNQHGTGLTPGLYDLVDPMENVLFDM